VVTAGGKSDRETDYAASAYGRLAAARKMARHQAAWKPLDHHLFVAVNHENRLASPAIFMQFITQK
jgi:hypothetical protein